MKDKLSLIKVIKENIIELYQQPVIEEILPSIRLKTSVGFSDKPENSKLGGVPMLPKGEKWPLNNYDNIPYSFLGQINLSEVNDFDLNKELPSKGILYFFFNLNSGDEGKVIYNENPVELYKPNIPEVFTPKKKTLFQRIFGNKEENKILQECSIEIYSDFNIPSWDSFKLEKIKKELNTGIEPNEAFMDNFFENKYDKGESESTSNHHLLGNYNGIQNEYHEQNFVENIRTESELTEDEISDLLKWKLLFQIDSDDNLKMNFGDCGRIYFFIHENDLKNKDFNKIKITADCY